MDIETQHFTYDYSPYRSQEGKEIPAFEILDESWEKVADTNENHSAESQEAIARLFAEAPDLLRVLEAAKKMDWDNVALTNDIEALRRICLQYNAWWNDVALPAIARAKGALPD